MNILYISHLFKQASSGPNYSVPAQIKAQSKLDNVFWLETTDTYFDFWLESGVFHNANEYKNVKIKDLPAPFNKPDLVVFEGFYFFEYIKYAKECRKLKIPYVIVPRSSLTKQGQKQKRLKKLVANFMFFNKFAKKASCIQFLTEKELKDSGFKWNKNNFVIPNGIYKRDLINREIKDNLDGCYVGRFAIYQKGLDLLLKACKLIKDKLINANISISFYGFENQEKIQFKKDIEDAGLSNILKIKEEIFGDEKDRVLKNSDFFIMTSRFEGMPMSLIEAASYALPCFATEGTYMAEDIKSFNAGWTCDTTVDDITSTLLKLIEDKGEFINKGVNAYNMALKYSWDELAKLAHNEFTKIVVGEECNFIGEL